MVSDVIIQCLLEGHSVGLPSVGTLWLESYPSCLTPEGDAIVPPHMKLCFQENEFVGHDIVDFISQKLGVGREQGEALYGDFYGQSQGAMLFQIEGVCSIDVCVGVVAALDDDFSLRLAPDGSDPLPLVRFEQEQPPIADIVPVPPVLPVAFDRQPQPRVQPRPAPRVQGASSFAITLSILAGLAAVGYVMWFFLK